MNKLLERLKASGQYANPTLRMLFSENITFGYDDDSGGIFAMTQGGEILDSVEFGEIIEGVNIFLSYYGDGVIAEINADREQRRRERQESPVKYKAERRKKEGFVYLILAENGLYKIGKSTNVSERMKPFSVNFPMKWDLIHSFKSGDYTSAEEYLHKRFADKRTIGEWFSLLPEDVEYIKSIQDGEL